MAACCKWAAPTNGAISSWASISAGAWAAQLYGLTSPLLTTSSGAKMGKTAAGAVWLNADLLPLTITGNIGATARTRTWSAS